MKLIGENCELLKVNERHHFLRSLTTNFFGDLSHG